MYVGRQKHVALHRRLASADFRILEQPGLCVGLLYPAAGYVKVFALALDADELQTHPGTGNACCAAAHERIANRPRFWCKAQTPLHQHHRLLCRVRRALQVLFEAC